MDYNSENSMLPIIAAFDFDGTITTKDSFLGFLIHSFGYKKAATKLFFRIPFISAFYFGGIWNREKVKQYIISVFFKDKPLDFFNKQGREYAIKIDLMLSSEAMERIRWHQKQNHEVVIVTASVPNWIEPWARACGIKNVIGTELDVKGGMLTGKLRTFNCRGKEKVSRFLEIYPERTSYVLYAYGDSRGDRELLNFADFSYFRKFS